MKPVTINVSEPVYQLFMDEAKRRDRKASELIRDAMEFYLAEKLHAHGSLDSWSPLSLGSVRSDWVDSSFRADMLDSRYQS